MSTETSNEIPKEYQRLTVTQAYEIMGITRPTFYRNHINNKTAKQPDIITVSVDESGNKYIDFSELVRVFGNKAYKKLGEYHENTQKEQNGQNDILNKNNETQENPALSIPFEELLNLKISLERKTAEVEQLEQRLTEQKQQTRAAEDREQKLYEKLERSQLLLEDKTKKENEKVSELASIKTLLEVSQQKPNFWQRLFGLTPSNKAASESPQSTENTFKSSKG